MIMHIKRLNEELSSYNNNLESEDIKVTILEQDPIRLQKEYDNFEDFYTELQNYDYEDYEENDNNTVKITFEDGYIVVKLEVSSYGLFDLMKEMYD